MEDDVPTCVLYCTRALIQSRLDTALYFNTWLDIDYLQSFTYSVQTFQVGIIVSLPYY
jgi:hypothetical protein